MFLAKRRDWVDRVPEIPMRAKRPPRDTFMIREQGARLSEAAVSLHLRLFIWFGLLTGQRKGAILGLTWDRTDLDRGILDFHDPEMPITKKRRAVTHVAEKDLLLALRDARTLARTPYVIEFDGARVGNIRKAFERTARRAGLPWMTPHVVKHSVISWLADDGAPMEKIAEFTQTSPATVRRIYQKFNWEALKDLSEGLVLRFQRLFPTVDFFDDGAGGSGPDERFGVGVVGFEIGIDVHL